MGTRPTCVSATTEKCFQRPDGWRRISDLWIWYFSVLLDWVPRQVPSTLPCNQILLPVRLNVSVDVCAPPVPKQRVPATLGSQFLPFPQHPPPSSPCRKTAAISMFLQARRITFIAFFPVSVLEITLKILSIFCFFPLVLEGTHVARKSWGTVAWWGQVVWMAQAWVDGGFWPASS